MKVKGLCIKLDGTINEVEIEKYTDYYPFIECEHFDVAYRKIGNKYYDIFVDDEGLLLEKKPIGFNKKYKEVLVGNCVIMGVADEEGRETSLTDEDIENILSQTYIYCDTEEDRIRLVFEYSF